MANNKNFIAKNGVSTGDGYAMPDVRPSLLLDFANSKTLDPRITFTRGSTATYWDGHTTTKAEENLVKYSQDYSQSDWSKFNLTVTDDATTAPDGTTTAASLITTTANNNHYIAYNYGNLANIEVTQSWFAKANGYNHCFVGHGIGTTEGAWFNLSTGSTGTVGGTITSSSITSVGNGWYRCSITYTVSQTVRYAIIAPTNADGTVFFTGDGTSGIYAWGAQLEQRSSTTAYTATTSSPIVKYQPTLQTAASGEARFDHDPVTGESKGLLIEESRVNYITSSENVAGSGGEAGNDGYISNVAVAPDGTLTADKLLQTDGTSSRQRRYDLSSLSTANQTVTASVYVKSDGSWQYAMVMLSDNSARRSSVTVDLDTGEITDAGPTGSGAGTYDSSSVEDVGNGWYRISLTGRSATGDVQYYLNVGMSNTATPSDKDYPTFTGNRYKGILVWGKQLEVGSFPTSYIPTSGSTVTRSADETVVGNATLSGWYNTNEGTVLAKFRFGFNSDNDQRYIVSGGNGYARWGYTNSGDNNAIVNYDGTSNTVTNVTADNVTSTLASTSSLITLKKNLAVDGNLAAELAASGDMNTLTTELRLGYYGSGTQLNGWLAKVAYYPIAFDRTTLAAMTEA